MTNDPLMASEVTATSEKASSRGWMWILIALAGVAILLVLMCAGVLAALLIPAVSSARTAARTVSAQNNLKLVGIAFQEYHQAHGQLPLSVMAEETEGQQKQVSWRVSLLPFLLDEGMAGLYDTDEQISVEGEGSDPSLGCPIYYRNDLFDTDVTSQEACVFVVNDPEGVMDKDAVVSFDDVTDGADSTLLAVSLSDRSVPWSNPEDLDLGQLQVAFSNASREQPVLVLFCDGSVEAFREPISPGRVRAMVTKAGND